MSEYTIKTLEFKYSVAGLCLRAIIGIGFVALSIVCMFIYDHIMKEQGIIYSSYYNKFYYYLGAIFWWIPAVIGVNNIIDPLRQLFTNKRIFLKLDDLGLYHYTLVYSRWSIKHIYIHHMPLADIESVYIKHGIFVRNKIELIIKKGKKGRLTKHRIDILCSEYNAEYILKAIHIFIQRSKDVSNLPYNHTQQISIT